MIDGVHGKKVGPHRAPVHLAQRGDARVGLHTANVKTQPVAQAQSQGVGQALFHADGAFFLWRPAARHHLVVCGCLRGIGEVELAVHQALGTVFGVVVRAHGAIVHGHQAATDHRIPVVLAHARSLQRLLKGVGLVGLHVDDEAVGCVGWRGLAPAGNQVGAQQHQQHQRQEAHGQATDLHHGVSRTGADLARGQHQPARRRGLIHRAAQQLDHHPGHGSKQHHGSGKATHGDQAQLQIAADHQQQCRKTQHAQRQHRQRCRAQRPHIAPDDAQRRHLRQLQHRRQAKGQQQGQAHAQAQQRGPQAGSGQCRLHQARQQEHKHVMHAKTQHHAQGAGTQAHQGKFEGVAPGDGGLALAQYAQQG